MNEHPKKRKRKTLHPSRYSGRLIHKYNFFVLLVTVKSPMIMPVNILYKEVIA